MFNISEVPRTRWVTVNFDVAGDYDQKTTHSIDLEVFVKTPQELFDMRKQALAAIEKQIDEGKEVPPNEAIHLVMAKSLINDWKGIELTNEDDSKEELPFTDTTWEWVISCVEAQAAIIKAISGVSKREDLITKN